MYVAELLPAPDFRLIICCKLRVAWKCVFLMFFVEWGGIVCLRIPVLSGELDSI